MEVNNEEIGRKTSLRQRAVEELRKKEQPAPAETPQGVAKLAHELGVHEIELEMQNEELRRAQKELEVSRQSFSDLFDFAPVGYFVLGEQGSILGANLAGAVLLGVEKASLIGKRFSNYINRDDQDKYYLFCNKMMETHNAINLEIQLLKKDAGPFYVFMEGTAAKDALTGKVQCRITLSDISGRKTAEEELRRHRDHLEELVRERTSQVENKNIQLKAEIVARRVTEDELMKQALELKLINEDLTRFNRAMVDRELRMIELKKQVNELNVKLGQPPCYSMDNIEGNGTKS